MKQKNLFFAIRIGCIIFFGFLKQQMCLITNYVDFAFNEKKKILNFDHMNWSNILHMTCRNWNSWDILFYFNFVCTLNLSIF
jgi:hypothetical protein